MQDTFFQNITEQTVVITATQRMAMALAKEAVAYQRRQGNTLWPTTAIVPYQQWLEALWDNYLTTQLVQPPLVLTDFQEHLLWEDIIAKSSYGESLLRITQTASLARQAWQMLYRWQVDYLADFAASEDTATFKEWALTFEARCHAAGWLNQRSLMQQLIELAEQQLLAKNKHYVLIGFIELSPLQQQLFATLSKAGCTWELYQATNVATQIVKLGLKDSQHELETMAQWAKQQVLACPQQTIACIITDLNEQSDTVDAVFTHTLASELLLEQKYEQTAFNLVTRRSLHDYPMICTAIICLSLGQKLISLEQLSVLFRSPFLAGAEQEFSARAMFDAQLRANGERAIALYDVLRLCGELSKANFAVAVTPYSVPILQQQLQDTLALFKSCQPTQTPYEWVSTFSTLLKLLGWPGERSLNSHEHQTKERWDQALVEFAQLTVIFPRLTYSQALEQLTQLLRSILFQPKVAPAQIHILTPNDALALSFDKIWIMGVNDHVWPPAPKPNPFIPFQLQRRLQLPHTTAEQELFYHQQLLSQLSQGAAVTILSYALLDADQALRPSALLKEITAIEMHDLQLHVTARLDKALFNSATLESIQDEQGNAIKVNEYVKGGIGIFKHQAACPFRAFALFRLGANTIENPATGLSAMERGNLVHLALEYLWKKIANHNNLNQYAEQDLAAIVQRSITKALLTLKKQRPQLIQPRFMALEVKRLTKLLNQWLIFEKQRVPFAVSATEQKFNYTFENINLQIRIDRIDQLADGSYLIIDYKTGTCSENAWFGERPDDPQLPFYCISTDLPVSGLMFAQLNSRNVKFKGITQLDSQAYAPNNLKPIFNWAEQKQLWTTTLTVLAKQFHAGYAKVDPKEAQTCLHCELTAICRIKEG